MIRNKKKIYWILHLSIFHPKRTHSRSLPTARRPDIRHPAAAHAGGAGALIQLQQQQRAHLQKHIGRNLHVSQLLGIEQELVALVIIVIIAAVVCGVIIHVIIIECMRRTAVMVIGVPAPALLWLLLVLQLVSQRVGVAFVIDGHVQKGDGRQARV